MDLKVNPAWLALTGFEQPDPVTVNALILSFVLLTQSQIPDSYKITGRSNYA